jgi:hypothetical protein
MDEKRCYRRRVLRQLDRLCRHRRTLIDTVRYLTSYQTTALQVFISRKLTLDVENTDGKELIQ